MIKSINKGIKKEKNKQKGLCIDCGKLTSKGFIIKNKMCFSCGCKKRAL